MFQTSFIDKNLISELTAKILIEVEAIKFNSEEPFKFTSGWASPVYIDCRKLISYPRVRNTLMNFATSIITTEIGFEKIDSIAGGETAGVQVDHTFVVFYYDIFPETRNTLNKINLKMHSLATWWDILKVLKDNNYFDNKTINEIDLFLNNPMKWSGMNGGISLL